MTARAAMVMACATVACHSGGRAGVAPSAAREAELRQSVEAALVHYDTLVRRMANDSIADLYTSDGELLGTNQRTIAGQDAIRTFLSRFTNVRVDTADMHSEAITVSGNEAVQWGTYRQVARVEGQGTVHVQGRFVAHWQLDATGRWRLRRMLAQPTPAP